MTKEQFIKRIGLIQNFCSEQETLAAMIYKLTDGFSVITFGDSLMSELIKTITENLNIADKDLLSWWLFEDVEKTIWFDEQTIDVSTVEQLWEYILKYEVDNNDTL